MREWKIAILGATGAVGREMRQILEESGLTIGELRLLASRRSAGERLRFRGREIRVRETAEEATTGQRSPRSIMQAILLDAPRILKEPVFCRFSHFR